MNAEHSQSSPRRLYMDNAATSFPKPKAVLEAMVRYASEVGASAGRGAYAEAVESAKLIHDCRCQLNHLFNGQGPEHFVFTLNCSESLNLAIQGLVDPSKENHAICTHIDHNSILRPVNDLAQRANLQVTRLPVDPATGLLDPGQIKKAITPKTRFIALTHASNVAGTVQQLGHIGRVAREHEVVFLVDAAQSAGHIPIDVQALGIDLLAAPGHKGLLGPLGTGILYIRPEIEKILHPLKQGGTGSVSESDIQPDFMPDKYESGSHNAIGIAGLGQAVRWVLQQGVEKLAAHDLELMRAFIDGVSGVPALRVFGPQGVANRMGVFSVLIEGLDCHELAAVLESHYGILTRPGLHCAPLVHRALGTEGGGGTTRFSFGAFLSVQDVKYATDALAEIALAATGGGRPACTR